MQVKYGPYTGKTIETTYEEAQTLNLLHKDFNSLKYSQRTKGNHAQRTKRKHENYVS
jgi:hypothetical protein